MEAEKLSETITKTGYGEKNPHVIKALIISLFAVALSFAGLGSSEELKTISADNIIESNYQTISEFRTLRQSLLQVSIDQLEINLGAHSPLTSAEKNNLVKIISKLKKEINLSESNVDKQDGKKEVEFKLNKVQNEKKLSIAKNKSFEYGEAFLQIAIVLISTSIISSIGGLMLGGGIIGALGIIAVANGFFLFFII
jgi:uncharacterized protein YlxP (DUF503 family)